MSLSHMGEQVAEGLGVLLFAYIGQLVLGTIVTGIVVARRLRSSALSASGWRAKTAWIALAMFALSIVADAWFLFAPNKSFELVHQTAVLGLSALCGAFVLALIGRGPGRIAIPIMSALFALPWLPFILT
jgi:hypothetical protein